MIKKIICNKMNRREWKKMFNKSKEKLIKEIVSNFRNNDEKQILLTKSKEIFDDLEKNFDKEQITGILEIIKVLNELFGF